MLGLFQVKIRRCQSGQTTIQVDRSNLKSNLFGVGCRDGGPATTKVIVVRERWPGTIVKLAGHLCEGGLAIVSDLLLFVVFEVL